MAVLLQVKQEMKHKQHSNMEKRILKFTDQELNILLYSLQKQPFETVNGLILNIVEQLKADNEVKVETKTE